MTHRLTLTLALGVVAITHAACAMTTPDEKKRMSTQHLEPGDLDPPEDAVDTPGGFLADDATKNALCDKLQEYDENELVSCTVGWGCIRSPSGTAAKAWKEMMCEVKDSLSCGSGGQKAACEGASGKLLTCCGGSCVETYADPFNCGGCGNRCDHDQICLAGTCQCAGNLLEDCPQDPPPPPNAHITCADIAAANGWPGYAQNSLDCFGSIEIAIDDDGNECCPVYPPPPDPNAG